MDDNPVGQSSTTTAAPQTQDWKQVVTAHYHVTNAGFKQEQAKQKAEEQERDRQIMLRELKEAVGPKAAARAAISDNGRSATLDGVEFGIRDKDWRCHLFIWGTCPTCGERCPSENINNPYDMGQALVDFTPVWSHEHHHPVSEPDAPPEASVPTAAEQLDAAIRRICREVAGDYGE